MIANRIAAGVLAAGMLMFVGACEPAQPTAPTTGPDAPGSPPSTTTPSETAPTTPRPNGTGGAASAAEKDQIVQPMMTRLESIREDIDELRAKQDQVPEADRAAFDTAMNDVQSKYSNAVLHVDRLREAEGPELQRMRDQVDPIFQELTTSLNQARALANGSGGGQRPQPQPGQQPQPQPQPGQQPQQQPGSAPS